MSLSPGTSLGHYDVTALLGEGGMGQVWQATDTQLNRQVALKILPDAFADDPDRLARFTREAQILASLNHPNIAAIYGIEEAEGTRALVLELVEGPTLADRISKGPIPLDEALPIAKQIAEALEAAHEAGVIHRDLKPANIKVREDGTVKVLDFGLAKALDPAPDVDPSQSPTLTAAATQMGVIMGTAAYMSPEQAKGKPVDKRADVWAFGAVLYEMLCGKRPFAGDDVSETLARVIDREPDWTALPNDVPPVLGHFLRSCLQKNPKRRVRDIGDVSLAMEGAFETTLCAPAEPLAAPQLRLWQRPAAVSLMVLMAAVLSGYLVWSLTPVPTRPVARFVASTSPAGPFLGTRPGNGNALAISPDGRRIAYLAGADAQDFLYLRPTDQLDGTPILSGFGPFFSPDGEWLGFASRSDFAWKKVSVFGGAPVTLWDVQSAPRGASWGPDDTIVFALSERLTGLRRGSAAGGDPEILTTPDATQGEVNHWWPEILPGGRAVLFTIIKGGQERDIAVLNLDTGAYAVVVSGGTYPRYASTGHIVYGAERRLRAVPFDLTRLVVTGDPVPVLENVSISVSGGVDFSLSLSGSLVYALGSGGADAQRVLAFVDRSGQANPLNVPPDQYLSPRLSPEGRRLAVQTTTDGSGLIWTYDLSDDRQIQQLTFEGNNQRPIWTPDGTRITFASDRDGTMSLYWQPADGSAGAERLTTAALGAHLPGSWSPDEDVLAFTVASGGGMAIWTLSQVDGAWESAPLLDVDGRLHAFPEFSPDGRWLAYSAGDTYTSLDVYVEPFPQTGRIERISRAGGYYPFWSRSGDRLFYRASNRIGNRLRAVDIETYPEFRFTNESLLAPEGFSVFTGYRDFDVTADGEEFLMVFPTGQDDGPRPEVAVVLNWFEELKERVPVP